MGARVYDQPAFLLHRREWQNTSLILDCLTLDYGRVNLIAKGGRSSRNRALFQPFIALTVSWTGQSDLHTLMSIEGKMLDVVDSSYLSLLYINELLTAFLPKNDSAEFVYLRYRSLLESTLARSVDQRDLRSFERDLMNDLGYLPDLGVDANSGLPIDDSCYYQFDPTLGFFRVEDASRGHAGSSILSWNAGMLESSAVDSLTASVMRSIIDLNLQGKILNSRAVYRQIKQIDSRKIKVP
jgi:DNA repair protein RecO (recombination protein O)